MEFPEAAQRFPALGGIESGDATNGVLDSVQDIQRWEISLSEGSN